MRCNSSSHGRLSRLIVSRLVRARLLQRPSVMRRCVWMVLVGVFLVAPVSAASSFHVRVVNLTGMQESALTRGLEEMVGLFERADIIVTWEVCGPCGGPPEPHAFWLRIAGEPALASAAFGTAVVDPVTGDGVIATVFAQRLQKAVQYSDRRFASLLGVIAAHELAHLLRGSVTHERSGIMQARWSASDIRQVGRMAFTPEEGAELRLGLAHRTLRGRNRSCGSGRASC